jgi:hypothetical protein
VTRRLSADCHRIDITTLTDADDVTTLLRAMGREIANVHLGDPRRSSQILDHLRDRPDGWLAKAAEEMAAAVVADWRTWRRR